MKRRTRSHLLAGLAVALTAASACSTTPESTQTSSSDFDTVTIEHALGEAVITEKPERIVTLGQGSTETAIALGTIPVGIEQYPWGSDETGYMPWIHEAIHSQGGDLPEQFLGGSELEIEDVLDLDPDLILAPWSGITQAQYDLLSGIAPTIAYPQLPWTITWQDQIEVIAQAMGQEDDGTQLVEDIETQLAAAARDEYADITFSYIYNDGPGTLGVFFPSEQRVAMVSALGLTVDPVIETLRDYEVEGTDSAHIGLENADQLADSDLIFTFYSSQDNRTEIESQPLYQQIPAVANGAVVAPSDQSFVTASSIINPLTVPWTLERFAPLIDEAIENLEQ
ncbi:iron-siderophore ABC transporter substrate-binding protein [Natronoglycomyces albus]|uniref:Iron-siderophore ABC transporter substrate-binding protein n=1 Tax=Natronoglycomyces albus TaxID=2811108 RepID=A0A895XSU1_9ACTN|nr:iron-siderophore ABC transporter substrate-binding protein [Natronoglycomyces albus]QSB06315.1 iron-siderophore ABC transporter substrate-binding protein [Natronoglycomyces albus]